MKRFYFSLAIAAVFLLNIDFALFAEGVAEQSAGSAQRASSSYAFGYVVGADLGQYGIEIDYMSLVRGLVDAMEKRGGEMTHDEARLLVEQTLKAAIARQSEENLVKEQAFMEENGKRPGVVTTDSGLEYEMLVEGTGAQPGKDDIVTVTYQGALPDGTIFDKSDGETEIPLPAVIPGWAEGIMLMKEGGKARLFIPSNLAYGPRGAGQVIPPNTPLVFEVELKKVTPQPSPEPEQQMFIPQPGDDSAAGDTGDGQP